MVKIHLEFARLISGDSASVRARASGFNLHNSGTIDAKVAVNSLRRPKKKKNRRKDRATNGSERQTGNAWKNVLALWPNIFVVLVPSRDFIVSNYHDRRMFANLTST